MSGVFYAVGRFANMQQRDKEIMKPVKCGPQDDFPEDKAEGSVEGDEIVIDFAISVSSPEKFQGICRYQHVLN